MSSGSGDGTRPGRRRSMFGLSPHYGLAAARSGSLVQPTSVGQDRGSRRGTPLARDEDSPGLVDPEPPLHDWKSLTADETWR